MLKVKKKCCNRCLFTKDKIVSNERKDSLLKSAELNDTHFSCHESTMEGQDHVCRGFFERKSTNLIRIAQRIGAIEYVD